jgi:succinate dehydrogenase / fumarate reductase cytochrome b subunit
LIVWATLAALIYHSVAGVKHLIQDMGFGETLEGGITGAKLTIIISGILIILSGALIW